MKHRGAITRLNKQVSGFASPVRFQHVDIDFLPDTPVPHKISAAGAVFATFSNLMIEAGLSQKQQNTIRQQGFAIRHEPAEGIPRRIIYFMSCN